MENIDLTNADIAAIAPAIASELGPEWSAEQVGDEHGPTLLTGPEVDGHPLVLSAVIAGTYRAADRGKISIGVSTSALRESETADYRYGYSGSDKATIRVSASKTPAAIAKDIVRRLIPEATEYHRTIVAIVNRHNAAVAAENVLESRLREVMGPYATWNTEGGYDGKRYHDSVDAVDVDVADLPYAPSLRIEHSSRQGCASFEATGLTPDELVTLMSTMRHIIDAREARRVRQTDAA